METGITCTFTFILQKESSNQAPNIKALADIAHYYFAVFPP
jgi:hypothetical protein